jgi:hypothetical protein
MGRRRSPSRRNSANLAEQCIARLRSSVACLLTLVPKAQLAALRSEMSRQFHWIAGVQVTVFVGIAAAIVSVVIALRFA